MDELNVLITTTPDEIMTAAVNAMVIMVAKNPALILLEDEVSTLIALTTKILVDAKMKEDK